MLRKEAQSKREAVDTSDVFVTTTVESLGLIALETLPNPPKIASLVGAIELSA